MSMGVQKVLCVVGTRPEAIKMAPVIQALRAEPWAHVRVLATAQHRQMLDQVLDLFGIVADIDLNIMQEGQTQALLLSRLIERVDSVLRSEDPAVVIAQGDTTTVLSIALACYYRDTPFAHVEAGLRTHNKRSPFPEEMNRVVAGYLARLHFAPTIRAKGNLLREGVPESSIFVTGNTVIDALLQQAARTDAPAFDEDKKRMILVTAHRRENFGERMENICDALVELTRRHNDLEVVFPVHPNPSVAQTVHGKLANRTGIFLCAPLDYVSFVSTMKRAWLILTDSGGVQEEAPALGKPVLVLRRETERPEAVEAGVAKVVGVDCGAIVGAIEELLAQPHAYKAMARGVSPYGDGGAAPRIVDALKKFLDVGDGSRHYSSQVEIP